jgi:hypothetical protein
VAVVTKAEAFLVNLEVEQTRTDAVRTWQRPGLDQLGDASHLLPTARHQEGQR